MSIYKDKLYINVQILIGLYLLCILFKGWTNEIYITYSFIFALVLFFASRSVIVNLPQIPDLSYGIYLWGWPIQQTIVNKFPEITHSWFIISTLITCTIISYASWFLVEKNALKFGKNFVHKFYSYETVNLVNGS